MSSSAHFSAEFAGTAEAGVARGFDVARKLLVIYAVAGAILLGTLVVVALAGGEPSVFMWARGTILLAMTPLLFAITTHAKQGRTSSLQRLRMLTTVLPAAIIGVDLIPGVCPTWYAGLQAVSALALAPIGFLTRRPEIRAAFPDQS